MRKRVRITMVVVLLVLLGLVGWRLLPEPEPIYKGKKLSLWLDKAKGADYQSDFYALTQENGPEVVPYLIKALRIRDNLLWKPYVWLQRHAPPVLAARMPSWLEPAQVRSRAAFWLAQTGSAAKPAVPVLCTVVLEDPKAEVRRSAAWALSLIGRESKEAVSVLVTALSRDPDPGVRNAAAGGLEMWTPDAPEVIPALIKGLGDTNAVVREVSAAALGKYGPRAKAAIEPLEKLAASDDEAADYASHALKEIDPEVAAKPTAK